MSSAVLDDLTTTLDNTNLYALVKSSGDFVRKSNREPFTFCSRDQARAKKRSFRNKDNLRIVKFSFSDIVR